MWIHLLTHSEELLQSESKYLFNDSHKRSSQATSFSIILVSVIQPLILNLMNFSSRCERALNRCTWRAISNKLAASLLLMTYAVFFFSLVGYSVFCKPPVLNVIQFFSARPVTVLAYFEVSPGSILHSITDSVLNIACGTKNQWQTAQPTVVKCTYKPSQSSNCKIWNRLRLRAREQPANKGSSPAVERRHTKQSNADPSCLR